MNFLQSQLQQRGSSQSNTASALNSAKNINFDDFRENISNDYQGSLELFADKLNTNISKEVAAKQEGIGVLSQVPVFFNSGKGSYAYMPGKVQRGSAFLGKKAKQSAEAVGKKYGPKAEKLGTRITNLVDKTKERVALTSDSILGPETTASVSEMVDRAYLQPIRNLTTPALEAADKLVTTAATGIKSGNLVEAGVEATDTATGSELNEVADDAVKTVVQDSENAQQGIIRRVLAPDIVGRGEDPFPKISKGQSEMSNYGRRYASHDEDYFSSKANDTAAATGGELNEVADDAAKTAATTGGELNEVADDAAEDAVKTGGEDAVETAVKTAATGGEINEVLDDAAAAAARAAAIAAEGEALGGPVLGAVAAIGGIAYGLSELFGHHAHHPKMPSIQNVTEAFQTRYNVGSSVLASGSSIVNSASGTTSF